MTETTLARVLAAELERLELSTAELARRAGVAQSQVWGIVNGTTTRPRWDTVLAILGALGKDLRWLHTSGIRPPLV